MSSSEWIKVDFQQIVNEHSNDIIINNAPEILYSKKDKEHEAYNSLIAFFFVAGGLLIYISLTYFLIPIYFNFILFIVIIVIGATVDVFLIINYLGSNVYIKPIECWVEIYKGKSANNFEFYCFTYYPIFSGKCHPNKAKNVIFKLYQEQVLTNKIDITQIEIYLKINPQDDSIYEKLGYFFQYGEGRPFRDENVDRASWKYFPSEESKNDNFIATANWDHQYEWREDLEFDFDKLHEYAPWVIQKWDAGNIKPLTEDFKEKIKWNLRYIESKPKLKPWNGEIEKQTYENPKAYKDLEIINEAIIKIIKHDEEIEKIREIKDDLPTFKSFFRDLVS